MEEVEHHGLSCVPPSRHEVKWGLKWPAVVGKEKVLTGREGWTQGTQCRGPRKSMTSSSGGPGAAWATWNSGDSYYLPGEVSINHGSFTLKAVCLHFIWTTNQSLWSQFDKKTTVSLHAVLVLHQLDISWRHPRRGSLSWEGTSIRSGYRPDRCGRVQPTVSGAILGLVVWISVRKQADALEISMAISQKIRK